MRELARLLNEMRDAGVVPDYALFGAIAQMRYTEAVVTIDAEILVSIPSSESHPGKTDTVSTSDVES